MPLRILKRLVEKRKTKQGGTLLGLVLEGDMFLLGQGF
jgi:hypothetical protein